MQYSITKNRFILLSEKGARSLSYLPLLFPQFLTWESKRKVEVAVKLFKCFLPLRNTQHHMLYPRNNLLGGGMSKILTLEGYFMRPKLVFQMKVFQRTFLLISQWQNQDAPLSLTISP